MQITSKGFSNNEGEVDLEELLEINDLEKLQEHFCGVADIFCFCVDESGNRLTEICGTPEEVSRVEQSVERYYIDAAFKRVVAWSLEEQAVEDTNYENLKVAAVSIRVENEPVLTWIVFAVLQTDENAEGIVLKGIQTVTTMKRFYKTLDLLRDITERMIRCKKIQVSAEEESRSSRFSEQEMSESLKRIETFAKIVQLLDSDEQIEHILKEILRYVGNYMHLSSCQIFRLQKDGQTVDLLEEWLCNGIVSAFDKRKDIHRTGILGGEKTRAISSDTHLMPAEKEAMTKMHLKAVIIIPVYVNGAASMYVSFCECTEFRRWQVDEIKFVNDTAKVIQSILIKRIQKNSLARSYEALEAILDNVGCAIYVKDTVSDRMLFANHILKKTFGHEVESGILDKIMKRGIPIGKSNGNYEIIHEEKGKWYDLYLTTIEWVDGREVSLYAIYDISDKKIYQKKIEQQVYTDFLTGLYNRMCCERDLARHIDEAKKQEQKGAILYLDLDDFKHINDGLGHQYGDLLLKAISTSFMDINEVSDTCYRMGGDEFVIIIPPQHIGQMKHIIDKIKAIFMHPWFLKDGDYYCTMSMGIVQFPDEGENVQDLIKKADIAMYEAKKHGKNRVAKYAEGLNTKSSERLDMEKNMRDAASGGYREFEVYYQPIIDNRMEGRPCTGAEALIRWNSQELGAVAPGEFIPLAEYLGLINPIGNHVLIRACEACKSWNDNGHPDFKVNVNLSVVQLLQKDIVEIIDNAIKGTQIRPNNLTLEVTENLAINDMERMKKILREIKALGVRIALDDFGTGYSSLNHIREIPLDVIKVDQNFVKDLAQDSFSQSFIKMVAELADAIKVNVCIEGVETKEQYDILYGLKISLVQGYYFDKPMKRDAFEKKYVYGK